MRKILLTGAALMLGTSAHAWTNMHEDTHADYTAGAATASMKTASVDKAGLEWDADKGGAASAWSDKLMAGAELAGSDAAKASAAAWSQGSKAANATVKTAAWQGQSAMDPAGAKVADDGGMVWAEADIKTKEMVGGARMAAAADMNMPKTAGETGMGGPLESAGGYPPCSRTVTDRCIQLHERGVRESLAQRKWGADAGAMGGPFEPAAADAKTTSSTGTSGEMKAGGTGTTMSGTGTGHMNNDMKAADHSGHTMPGSGQTMSGSGHMGHGTTGTTSTGAKAGTAASPSGGVGGPDIRTGYPACSRTVTDSCIQLHERGVSGQGN